MKVAGTTHLLGQSMGRYLIQSVIGSGGFATVYRAVDTTLERQVALKVVDPTAHRSPTIGRRFVLEGRAVASLNHPAIVPVYDAGEHDGVLWLAMRLIEGSSLDHALASGRRLVPEETLALLDRIGAALDHAHAHGIVHRDVKPSNILLEDNDGGRAWLADFGIAATARTAGLYTTGALGTAAYMAPEQSRPSEVGPPADVYSLACVAYELVTGRRPFPGEDYVALLLAHATAPVPPTGQPAVDALMARALAKQPAARPASGLELAGELRSAVGSEPTALAPDSPMPLRLAAAGSVPTVVEHRDNTMVYPAAVAPAPPPAAPPAQPHRPPPPAPLRPPPPPLPGFHPGALPPPQPVRDPTVVRTSRRLGRRRLLAGSLLLLVGAAAGATALVDLNRGGGTRTVTDQAGISYEVPTSWTPDEQAGQVTWSEGDTAVATVAHGPIDEDDAVTALLDAEPAVCEGTPSAITVQGANGAARCDNSEGASAAAIGALFGGERWVVTVASAVPENQREDFLASLDFS
jgi:serine/threonine protein kinase